MKNIKKITLFSTLIFFSIIVFGYSYDSGTDDKITVKGTFTNITRPNVTLKTEDGKEYNIHVGPYWYWDDNGYALALNSDAEVTGKLESGTNDIYAYKVSLSGKTINLVDDNNDPLWWKSKNGRGKGNNDGWGRGNNNGWGRGNGKGMGFGNRCARFNR